MAMADFSLAAPKSAREACEMLEQQGGRALPLAGGTDLIGLLKKGLKAPERLVDLMGLPELGGLRFTPEEGLRAGAAVSLRRLAEHPAVSETFPVLLDAALAVGSPQLRAMGTVGGNLCQDTCCVYFRRSAEGRQALAPCIKLGGAACHAVKGSKICWATFMGDVAPALLVLGATVTVADAQGQRRVPLEELYNHDGARPLKLRPGELLTEVRVPTPPRRSGGAYLKLRRRQSIDYPLLGVAVQLTVDEEGRICREASIALTGVERSPVPVPEARELQGREPLGQELAEVAEAAYRRAHPMDNAVGLPPSYRKEMVRVYVRRAVERAFRRAIGEEVAG